VTGNVGERLPDGDQVGSLRGCLSRCPWSQNALTAALEGAAWGVGLPVSPAWKRLRWSGSSASDTISGAKRWFCSGFANAVTYLVTR